MLEFCVESRFEWGTENFFDDDGYVPIVLDCKTQVTVKMRSGYYEY